MATKAKTTPTKPLMIQVPVNIAPLIAAVSKEIESGLVSCAEYMLEDLEFPRAMTKDIAKAVTAELASDKYRDKIIQDAVRHVVKF